MSADIGPGTWWQAIRTSPLVQPEIQVGRVFFCTAVINRNALCSACGETGPSLVLADLDGVIARLRKLWPPGVLIDGWCHCDFRPYGGPERDGAQAGAVVRSRSWAPGGRRAGKTWAT
jgi:hypothetical protein